MYHKHSYKVEVCRVDESIDYFEAVTILELLGLSHPQNSHILPEMLRRVINNTLNTKFHPQVSSSSQYSYPRISTDSQRSFCQLFDKAIKSWRNNGF